MPTGNPIMITAFEWLSIVAVLSLLFTIAKILIGKQGKQLEQRLAEGAQKMEANEKLVAEVRLNYLSKFTEVKEVIYETRTQIILAISEVKLDIAKNYVTKTDCKSISEKEETT